MVYEALKKGDWVIRSKNPDTAFKPEEAYEVDRDCEETEDETKTILIKNKGGWKGGWNRGNFTKVSGPDYKKNNITTKMTNLIKKFSLLTKGEPERTFIKAGVTDDNGVLTSDGKTLFDAFMLKKYGAEFKKEVVDPILAEDEEK